MLDEELFAIDRLARILWEDGGTDEPERDILELEVEWEAEGLVAVLDSIQ